MQSTTLNLPESTTRTVMNTQRNSNNVETAEVVKQKKINEIAERIVRNEVFCCVTEFVEFCLKADAQGVKGSPVTEDDLFSCENYREDEDGYWPEILEWYAVTYGLACDLKERGEIVLETGFYHVWGRKTSGQAISIDGVIQEIAENCAM